MPQDADVVNWPRGSFQAPVIPPAVDPDAEPLTCAGISEEWMPLVNGALLQLQLPSTWIGDAATVELAQQRAALLMELLNQTTCAADDLAPYWDDTDAGDAEGTPAESEYSWNERIEDWAIAAFVASAGVPGASVAYLTIAPKFRLLFKRRDWGGIAKIFIDDVQVGTVDTYSPLPDVAAFDLVMTG